MELFNIILFLLLCFWLIALYMYIKYRPKIDIVTSRNKYIVLLWYNKMVLSEERKRTYIKLFEI